MRVCFVSHGSGRGGAEEVLLETVECLKENGIECLVLMPGDLGLGEDLKKLGIPFWKVPYWTWMGHRTLWQRLQSAARNLLLSIPIAFKLKKWNPDVIYSNTMTVCFGALLSGLLRRPHVWHLHEIGYEDHGLRFDFGERVSYKVINSASACIAVSEITAEKFAQHIDRQNITVMFQSIHRQARWRLGVCGEVEVPARKHALRCVIVGRVSEGKRQEDAVVAIAELKRQGIDVELLIVGRGNPGYPEKIERLVRANGLDDRVFVFDSVPDRLPFVESADVVLMCSRFEAFGRVTVEGMLAGKPVVAANTGANPELIKDGFNGLLYDVRATKDLANKIRYLYEHPEIAQEIGRNARAWAEPIFNKERFSREIVSFLESVSAPRSSRLSGVMGGPALEIKKGS